MVFIIAAGVVLGLLIFNNGKNILNVIGQMICLVIIIYVFQSVTGVSLQTASAIKPTTEQSGP